MIFSAAEISYSSFRCITDRTAAWRPLQIVAQGREHPFTCNTKLLHSPEHWTSSFFSSFRDHHCNIQEGWQLVHCKLLHYTNCCGRSLAALKRIFKRFPWTLISVRWFIALSISYPFLTSSLYGYNHAYFIPEPAITRSQKAMVTGKVFVNRSSKSFVVLKSLLLMFIMAILHEVLRRTHAVL